MPVRKRTTKRVFGLSLTEVALLLVFLLLSLLAASIPQDSELKKYKKEVQEVLELLGVSLGELRKTASHLIDAGLVEKPRKDLLSFIEGLRAENRRLRERLALSDDEVRQLKEQTKRAKEELAKLKGAEGQGGTEPGSCWSSADGRVEYFLQVVLHDRRLNMQPVWPSSRKDNLLSLGINSSAVPSGEVENLEFSRFAVPIYYATVARGCRLFVRLVDRTTNKEAYKRQRNLVERYFFVREVE
ncbi:hypothetical protein ACFL0Q_02255 [Thermodesulfobacteriota bacterium]